jgi:hypothetical protein
MSYILLEFCVTKRDPSSLFTKIVCYQLFVQKYIFCPEYLRSTSYLE